jgi:hypothetical protein
VWAGAARRIAKLVGVSVAVIVVVSIVLGLGLGSSIGRAVSLGFYLVGTFLLVTGFFMGIRGPIRLRGEPGEEGPWGLGRRRGVRMATPDERRDSSASTAIFVSLGFVLIVFGVLADSRFSLY